MLRLLVRLLGYLLLAGAFVCVVVDGTRSIAASSLLWLRLGDVLERLSPKAVPALQSALGGVSPALWEAAGPRLVATPLSILLLALGILLVLLAADREPRVGILARR
ncbi:MAG: hypothetical protein U1E62_15210 [Alsobacter sp.]